MLLTKKKLLNILLEKNILVDILKGKVYKKKIKNENKKKNNYNIKNRKFAIFPIANKRKSWNPT
jgi:hypothetical protein